MKLLFTNFLFLVGVLSAQTAHGYTVMVQNDYTVVVKCNCYERDVVFHDYVGAVQVVSYHSLQNGMWDAQAMCQRVFANSGVGGDVLSNADDIIVRHPDDCQFFGIDRSEIDNYHQGRIK